MSLIEKSRELREQRRKIHEEQRSLVDLVSKENRELNAEELERWDRAEADVERLTAEIEDVERRKAEIDERLASLEARDEAWKDAARESAEVRKGPRPSAALESGLDPSNPSRTLEQSRADFVDGIRTFFLEGPGGMTPEQRKRLRVGAAGGADGVPAGAAINIAPERRANSTAGGDGGDFIAEDFYRRVISGMLAYGGVRAAGATVINSSTGADLPMPTENNTTQKGAILGENTQASAVDFVTGAVTLEAYMYTSNIILASLQLIQDSAFDLEGFIAGKLSERIGRILNDHFTTGTGSSQPRGFITAIVAGTNDISRAAITRATILDLVHQVDPAYRNSGRCRFQMHDAQLRAIKTLDVGASDARPLWQPGMAFGEPDTIDGHPYVINQSMESASATGDHVLAFGDWSHYFIRDVQGLQIVRFAERYMDFLQIGWMGYSRHDGDLVDPAGNAASVLTLT